MVLCFLRQIPCPREVDNEKKVRAQEAADHKAETEKLRGELDAAKADAKEAHEECSQWFSDYCELNNEKASIQKKFDALDDSNLKALEQALDTANETMRSYNKLTTDICSIFGTTAPSLCTAVKNISSSELTGDPARAAFLLFLGYVDAATTYMESSVGGGGVQGQLTDWSGRKLNEPDEEYICRCIDKVRNIISPKQTQVANVAPTVIYSRKR